MGAGQKSDEWGEYCEVESRPGWGIGVAGLESVL